MVIDHIALYVNDLEGTKAFFETYLGATCTSGLYRNKTTGFKSYFLSFDGDARLEIMQKPVMQDAEKTLERTGYIHLAFSVGGKERVDELTERLRGCGYQILSGPRTTGDGYYETAFLGPEGNQIEITA